MALNVRLAEIVRHIYLHDLRGDVLVRHRALHTEEFLLIGIRGIDEIMAERTAVPGEDRHARDRFEQREVLFRKKLRIGAHQADVAYDDFVRRRQAALGKDRVDVHIGERRADVVHCEDVVDLIHIAVLLLVKRMRAQRLFILPETLRLPLGSSLVHAAELQKRPDVLEERVLLHAGVRLIDVLRE